MCFVWLVPTSLSGQTFGMVAKPGPKRDHLKHELVAALVKAAEATGLLGSWTSVGSKAKPISVVGMPDGALELAEAERLLREYYTGDETRIATAITIIAKHQATASKAFLGTKRSQAERRKKIRDLVDLAVQDPDQKAIEQIAKLLATKRTRGAGSGRSKPSLEAASAALKVIHAGVEPGSVAKTLQRDRGSKK